jgi:hypothetical protein
VYNPADRIIGQKDLVVLNIPGCGLNLVDLNLRSTGITDEGTQHLYNLLLESSGVESKKRKKIVQWIIMKINLDRNQITGKLKHLIA